MPASIGIPDPTVQSILEHNVPLVKLMLILLLSYQVLEGATDDFEDYGTQASKQRQEIHCGFKTQNWTTA